MRRLLLGATGALLAAGAAAYYRSEQDVEKPDFDLLDEEGEFSLRAYHSMLVAEITLGGDRETALSRGFTRLADYIFAKHRPGEKIAMTAPVLQGMTGAAASAAGAGPWFVRFVMPSGYSKETLPPPPPDIEVVEVPARRIAAIRFSGLGGSRQLARKREALRGWLSERGLSAEGAPEYAFYNSPFIPPFLRRNEILVEIGPEG